METPEELENRLLGVIGAADTTLLKDEYLWAPFNTDEPPRPGSVACVRDGEAWHQFVPAQDGDPEEDRFKAVCFRYAEDGPSAIGFVGWLHTQLRELGQVGAVCMRRCKSSPRKRRDFPVCGRSKTLPPVAFDLFRDGRWEDVYRGPLSTRSAGVPC